MRAVVADRYGPYTEVLSVVEMPRPTVRDDEVLVEVKAASVHPDIWHVVTGQPPIARLFGGGVFRPKHQPLGIDASGVVVGIGSKVTDFAVGDEVYGETHRGFQWQRGGAFAEYVAAPAENLRKMPPNLSFEQAATVPTAGMIALFNMPRELVLGPHSRVLVNGAGGGVGSTALQLAKALGAWVTAVDTQPKLSLLRDLGADEIVDFRESDVRNASERFDLVFDVASTLSVKDAKGLLTKEGKFVVIGHDHFGRGKTGILGGIPAMMGLTLRGMFDSNLPRPDSAPFEKSKLMARLDELARAGQLVPVIDSVYPFEQLASALNRLCSGEAVGRIVVTP